MCSIESALEYLNRNKLQNVPAITSINRGWAEIAAFDYRGIIVYDKVNDHYFVSAEENSIMDNYLERMTEKYAVIALREKNISYIENYKPTIRTSRCYQIVYTGARITEKNIEGLEIRKLDESYADTVSDIYSLKLHKSYIEDRLRTGNVFGAFKNGQLAGFCGRHDEGAMGMLEVLSEYRRQGIATALSQRLINIILDSGEIPYAHIMENNNASLSLSKSFKGMQLCGEKMAWLIYQT